VPSHFPSTRWGWRTSRHRPLETPIPPGSIPTGKASSFNYGRPRCELLALLGDVLAGPLHADGLRVDPSVDALTSTISQGREWIERAWGRENLSHRFLQPEHRGLGRQPGAQTYARSPPPPHGRACPGRSGWEAWGSASSGTWAGCTTRWAYMQLGSGCIAAPPQRAHLPRLYAFHENFVLPSATTSSTARAPCSTRWRGRWQKRANLRRLRQPVVAPGKKLLFHGERVPASGASGPTESSMDWHPPPTRRTPESSSSSPIQRRDAPGRRLHELDVKAEG